MKAPCSNPLRKGFTLVETALAVCLMAVLVLPLLGLLGLGAAESGKARNHQRVARVRQDLRMRLQDPGWPSASREGQRWVAEFPYDRDGAPVRDGRSEPLMEVSLQGMAAPGFQCGRYEAVRVRIVAAKSKRLLDETVIQRRKEEAS